LIRPGLSCDIFCRVVDNFGDIGVTWRLARQLTHEHGVGVRLMVDDLASFCKLEPSIDAWSARQQIIGVEVVPWDQAHAFHPARLVIEAFAVNLPDSYIAAMSSMITPPIWINLEYLSAEAWVGEHHLLRSPHPKLPLTKHFFYPGFTPDTGGLIRESDLLTARNAFVRSGDIERLRVFLFGYPNAAAGNLLRAMAESATPIACTVPDGALATNLMQTHSLEENRSSRISIEVIDFVPQNDFDILLWKHDVLFVRGEDSFLRAQWAARPFVWQIYRQSEGAHQVKLDAFLMLYCDGLEAGAASALRELWRAWNDEDQTNIGAAWRAFVGYLPALRLHAEVWARKLAQMPDLAANLLSFYQKTTKI
jgi:uncharacterized repeat protein (TIGR03837 family)